MPTTSAGASDLVDVDETPDHRQARTPRSGWGWLRLVSIFAICFGAYLALLLIAMPHTTGDEPHYLLIAESLVHDHDLSLANNYANADQVQIVYPSAGPLGSAGHAAVYHQDGALVPIHNVGLPILLSPGVALGHGWFVARLLMVLLSALVGPLLLASLDAILPGRRLVTYISVLATMLTVPMFGFSVEIYPDVPGALLVTFAFTMLVTGRDRGWTLTLASCAAALLPWFHVRFLVLTAAFAVAVICRAIAGASGKNRLRVFGVLAPLVASGVGIMVFNHALYGSVLPNAAYRSPPFPTPIPFTARGVYNWTIGDILSPAQGVAPLAPVILLSIAGLFLVVLRWKWWGLLGVVTAVGYYLLASGVGGSGGGCPPGRWIVPIAPILAVPLLLMLESGWRARIVFAVTAAYSLVMSFVIFDHYMDIFAFSTDVVTLPVARSFASAWPQTGSTVANHVASVRATLPLVLVWTGVVGLLILLVAPAQRRRPVRRTGQSYTHQPVSLDEGAAADDPSLTMV